VPCARSTLSDQIAIGVIVLVVTSSYTANLAAYITISSRPLMSVSSLDATISGTEEAKICTNMLEVTKLTNIYSRLQVAAIADTSAQFDPADWLNSRRCDGIVVAKTEYDTYRTDATYCRLRVAEVLYPSVSGWVTNTQSPCVNHAISYSLKKLSDDGTLVLMMRAAFPEVPCASPTASDDMTTYESSRRQLRASDLMEHGTNRYQKHRLTHHGPQSVSSSLPVRRKLSSFKSSFGESDADSTGLPQMAVTDFLGLFIVWAAMSVFMVSQAYLSKRQRICLPWPKVRPTPVAAKKTVVGGTDHFAEAHVNARVNYDNEASMLKEVLHQLVNLRAEMNMNMIAKHPLPVEDVPEPLHKDPPYRQWKM
jgi:hypothetical protein